jgi:hypothetical protein
MFTIEKKPEGPLGAYTHNVYLKGVLLSEYGYYEKNIFYMDGSDAIDIEEFFPFKIVELPPWLLLYVDEHYLYKEFRLAMFDFKNGKVNFDIDMHERAFISSPVKFSSLKFAALALAQELYGLEGQTDDWVEQVYWTIPIEWQGEETVEDVYKRAKKEAMKFYDSMLRKAKTTLN